MTDITRKVEDYAKYLAGKHTMMQLAFMLSDQTKPGTPTYCSCDCSGAMNSRGGHCCPSCLVRAINIKYEESQR